MFTGIITETTVIASKAKTKAGLRLTFKKPKSWTDLSVGESVATDGVCLTVSDIKSGEYVCDLVPETLAKTSFGKNVPENVNLERALSANDRLSGHFVQGHVDGMGKVSKVVSSGEYRLYIDFEPEYKNYVVYKGSVTVNGVALTVAEVHDTTFCVVLVPHTLQHTTLGSLKSGDSVNLEFDIIGKYVAKIMEKPSAAR